MKLFCNSSYIPHHHLFILSHCVQFGVFEFYLFELGGKMRCEYSFFDDISLLSRPWIETSGIGSFCDCVLVLKFCWTSWFFFVYVKLEAVSISYGEIYLTVVSSNLHLANILKITLFSVEQYICCNLWNPKRVFILDQVF